MPPLQCLAESEYYAQCLEACPEASWHCARAGAPIEEHPAAANEEPLGEGGDSCRFAFGTAFVGPHHDYGEVDHLSVWLGQAEGGGVAFNDDWNGAALRVAKQLGATPVFYSYLIASLARQHAGLEDCDVGHPPLTLCARGAAFVREQLKLILAAYESFARESASVGGRSLRVVWLLEPDIHQYSATGGVTQEGGGLPQLFMVELLRNITVLVRRHLPNAEFSMDISPWVTDQRAWLVPFLEGVDLSFMHTSGGRTDAHSERIRITDPTTWFEIHQISGLGLIADTGYGVAGESTGHDRSWDSVTNLGARVRDGVVALTQANPSPTWLHGLNRLRSQLPALPPPPSVLSFERVRNAPACFRQPPSSTLVAASAHLASLAPVLDLVDRLRASAGRWDTVGWTLAVAVALASLVAAAALFRGLVKLRCCCGGSGTRRPALAGRCRVSTEELAAIRHGDVSGGKPSMSKASASGRGRKSGLIKSWPQSRDDEVEGEHGVEL